MQQAQLTQPLFTIRDATVRRAGKNILCINSFDLAVGEKIAVLGPNGSGKSTLIQLLTREVLPLHRKTPPVCFKGNARAVRSDVYKSLGVVSSTMQDKITVHLSVEEVVEGGCFGTLGLPFHVSSTPETAMKAAEAISLLGISDLATRDIMTLSSGQARRVLIARALVNNPETLVFDEPCSGLDPEGMHHIRSAMRTLAQLGKGIVLVTHYPEDIIPEISRVVLLKEGEVFDDGAKQEMLSSKKISKLFDIDLICECRRVGDDEYFSLVSTYQCCILSIRCSINT